MVSDVCEALESEVDEVASAAAAGFTKPQSEKLTALARRTATARDEYRVMALPCRYHPVERKFSGGELSPNFGVFCKEIPTFQTI